MFTVSAGRELGDTHPNWSRRNCPIRTSSLGEFGCASPKLPKLKTGDPIGLRRDHRGNRECRRKRRRSVILLWWMSGTTLATCFFLVHKLYLAHSRPWMATTSSFIDQPHTAGL